MVVIRTGEGDRFRLLQDTLEQAGFWKRIETVRESCKLKKTGFRIIIKPDLELFDVNTPTGTDPAIVEYLVALLHRRGYEQVMIAGSAGSSALWLENRDIDAFARLVGYRLVTSDDRPYPWVDLGNDVIEGGFPPGGALSGSQLGRAWLEAHFRIGMAKNKTHEENFFSLGLQNLLGVLPLKDKHYHYYHRLDPGDVCIELLRRTQVHFSIIDAVISNHGNAGISRVNSLNTNTIIAGEDLLLTDWAAALKMGIDPYASPLNAKALRTIGLPRQYNILGDLSPYPGWVNVPLLLSDSIRRRNKSVVVRQIVRPWFQQVNRELFPFKHAVDERINDFISNFLYGDKPHPLAFAAKISINYLLAASQNVLECYHILYNKEKVRRKQTSLGIDLELYTPGDYQAVVDYMEPLARIASQIPPDPNGLRWRYIDQSVLFEFTRHLPLDYDRFVTLVDISAAVRMMNDNIGGACLPVIIDNRGCITCQAERNIYLPQPNWMVLFGGKVIDVGKLEYIRIEENRRQIFWKTVTSANHSATFDDGLVTFARDDAGKTVITIVARQQFTLPLLWQIINMDFLPQIKDRLVSDAYITFFSRTIANFEAAFEGRSTFTGRDWNLDFVEEGDNRGKLPMEQVAAVFMKFLGFIQPLLENFSDSQRTSLLHRLGFKHLIGKRLVDYIQLEFAEKFLVHLLKFMSLFLSLDRNFKRNIENFTARYLFKIKDRNIAVAAVFKKNRLKVIESEIENTDVSVMFRNSAALMHFLLSPDPDIFDCILNQDIAIDGNVNYLFKLAYMARHLRLIATGRK